MAVTEPEVWRTSSAGRRASWCMTISFGAGAVAALVTGIVNGRPSTLAGAWLLAAILAATSVAFYRGGVVARIEAYEDGLVVINPLRHTHIAWSDIEKVTPGYNGLVIKRRSSSPVRAWAVQKSNWSAARNKQVRADRVAEEIAQRAAAADARPPVVPLTPSAEDRIALSLAARRTMVTAFTILVATTIIRVAIGRF